MLSLYRISRTRVCTSHFLLRACTLASTASSAAPPIPIDPPAVPGAGGLRDSDVVSAYKDWAVRRSVPLLERVYAILGAQNVDDPDSVRSADLALSRLGLRLSEAFVLKVLRYGGDVLSCIKFYDWAGRQVGFIHTHLTFIAIFKILSKAKLNDLMLDFLHKFKKRGYKHTVQFKETLVMGYALAGKLEVALKVFAEMRYKGLDLGVFGYHVLLNSLVEKGRYDLVGAIRNQIVARGFECEITHSIMMRSFCKQEHLDEAEVYLQEMLSQGKVLSGCTMIFLVDALCKSRNFDRAAKLIEEVNESGLVPMDQAHGFWIGELVRYKKLDKALKFLYSERVAEGYLPDVFRYNILILRLLRKNRLEELYDLLMEMKECKVYPDKVTVNAALCFFCKAGMVSVAQEMYNVRDEFRLSPNSMAHNYWINTFCGDGNINEAVRALKSYVYHGYVPCRRTFSIIGNALCKEGKLDNMKDLVILSLELDLTPSSTYAKFISALCGDNRVEDDCLIHKVLDKISKVTSEHAYVSLIHGFSRLNRGDIAVRLLCELQSKGHKPRRKLFRSVIQCLCNMENPESQFHKFLELQLSPCRFHPRIYNFFLDGAGYAGRPDLAREVFEMMQRNGIRATFGSHILMLRSYLRNNRCADAVWFFSEFRDKRLNPKGRVGIKMYNCVIVGICQAGKLDIALDIYSEVRSCGRFPSTQVYELLVVMLCSDGRYDAMWHVIDDFLKDERQITSFLGNTLLLHSLKTPLFHTARIPSRLTENESSSVVSSLRQLIGIFSGCVAVSGDIYDIEKMIEKCFPLDTFTYNLLLRRLSTEGMEQAYEVIQRMRRKGLNPDRWTYDIIVYSLLTHRMDAVAGYWLKEMLRKGFEPNNRTKLLISSCRWLK